MSLLIKYGLESPSAAVPGTGEAANGVTGGGLFDLSGGEEPAPEPARPGSTPEHAQQGAPSAS
ncbi:MAG: hypothetical protein ACRDJU_01930 [Actinomycetota bacterium]